MVSTGRFTYRSRRSGGVFLHAAHQGHDRRDTGGRRSRADIKHRRNICMQQPPDVLHTALDSCPLCRRSLRVHPCAVSRHSAPCRWRFRSSEERRCPRHHRRSSCAHRNIKQQVSNFVFKTCLFIQTKTSRQAGSRVSCPFQIAAGLVDFIIPRPYDLSKWSQRHLESNQITLGTSQTFPDS